MRRVLPLMVVLLAAAAAPLAAPPAAAQAPPVEIHMTDADGAYYFEGGTGGPRNPVLAFPAGATVTLRATNTGTTQHNFRVGQPVDAQTPCCQNPGESATVTFTIPESARGDVRYWCVLHQRAGMEGILRVSAPGGVPTLAIEAPREGATVPPEFTVRVDVENFTLVAPRAGLDRQEGQGHLHYLVNGTTGLPGWDTDNTSFRVQAVGEGYHYVRVELVGNDHQPLDPPVIAERIVYVSRTAPPETAPAAAPTTTPEPPAEPNDSPAPGAALLLTILGASAAGSWRRRRGPR